MNDFKGVWNEDTSQFDPPPNIEITDGNNDVTLDFDNAYYIESYSIDHQPIYFDSTTQSNYISYSNLQRPTTGVQFGDLDLTNFKIPITHLKSENANLLNDDISNLQWNVATSDTSFTLSGYHSMLAIRVPLSTNYYSIEFLANGSSTQASGLTIYKGSIYIEFNYNLSNITLSTPIYSSSSVLKDICIMPDSNLVDKQWSYLWLPKSTFTIPYFDSIMNNNS